MDKKHFPFPSTSENAKTIQDAQNHGTELPYGSVWVVNLDPHPNRSREMTNIYI